MNLRNCLAGLAVTTLLGGLSSLHAQPTLAIHADKPGVAISPTMHGIFFEDINYGADGGLYAELVQNRSFEHRENLYAWSKDSRGGEGEMKVETDDPLNAANKHYLRLDVKSAGRGFGAANSGFGGIAVVKDDDYLFSVHARCDEAFKGSLLASLEDEKGQPIGQCRLEGLSGKWGRFTGTIKAGQTVEKAHLAVLATASGRVDLDMVSLFPRKTWKNRPNGLRADLAKMLADLKPGFMRFPGGCIVEGMDLANMYRWKDTIGDVAQRPQNWNRWMITMKNALAPQYYQTYGLGFYEYFQLCEDIGATPLPILNCGMTCQFYPKDCKLIPLDQLGPFVQDALDLVEFANGPADSAWGARRAAMGHPEPFNLKYIGIGNEQWHQEYFDRYEVFYKAIKAKYPDIVLITTAGPGVDDEKWKFAWNKFKTVPADIVDEHYYRPPQWFYDQIGRYERYDRKGPKVFAGEYAAHASNRHSTLACALAEAAFLTSLVKNADVVVMSSYAPLFAKVGNTQWQPDLIWFDNTRVCGTPSYYAHQLFGVHKGDVVLTMDMKGQDEKAKRNAQIHAVATYDKAAGEIIIKAVNPTPQAMGVTIELQGAGEVASQGRAIVLTADSAEAENTLDKPTNVSPKESVLAGVSKSFRYALPANSLTVLRIKAAVGK